MLRYGFYAEYSISLEDIDRIELNRKSLTPGKGLISFSPFGMLDPRNIIIHLKGEKIIDRMYGIKKEI